MTESEVSEVKQKCADEADEVKQKCADEATEVKQNSTELAPVKRKPGRPKGTTGIKKSVKCKKPPNAFDLAPAPPPEAASAVASFMLEVAAISQNARREDPQTLLNCFWQYVQLCSERGMRVGNLGAYLSMGISKVTAEMWYNGKERVSQPEYKQLIETVKNVCAMTRETLMSSNNLNPIVGIFWQKAFDGLKDNAPEVAVSVDLLGDKSSTKSIAEKYSDMAED